MLAVHDYSSRRGVLVPLLPQIHALLTETAKKDSLAGIEPPINIILWKQQMNKQLVDINRKWLVVLNGNILAGLFFFRFLPDGNIYLDELRIAWAYRNNNAVFTLLHDRFINDPAVKKAADVFGGMNIKKEKEQEILASVGFEQEYENKPEPLGNPVDAAGILKIRYLR
jgi:hypothetical protein